MRVAKPLWLLIGGASIVAERVVGAVAQRDAVDRPEPTAGPGPAAGEVPPVTGVRAVLGSLTSRGEELDRRSRARAGRYLNSQLDRLLEPLVDRALPIVLDRLGQRREQVRAIVWEHGEDLTGELVAGIRDRAAAADATAERLARRLLGGRRERSASDEQAREPAPPAGPGVRP